MLPALAREEVRAHRRQRLDYRAVHAAVDDAVALQVLLADRELGADLVLGRVGDRHAHRRDPTLGDLVQAAGEVFGHERESYRVKKVRAERTRPLLRSTFAVLPP